MNQRKGAVDAETKTTPRPIEIPVLYHVTKHGSGGASSVSLRRWLRLCGRLRGVLQAPETKTRSLETSGVKGEDDSGREGAGQREGEREGAREGEREGAAARGEKTHRSSSHLGAPAGGDSTVYTHVSYSCLLHIEQCICLHGYNSLCSFHVHMLHLLYSELSVTGTHCLLYIYFSWLFPLLVSNIIVYCSLFLFYIPS